MNSLVFIVFAIALALGVLLGATWVMDVVTKDCQTMNAFRFGSSVYQCLALEGDE